MFRLFWNRPRCLSCGVCEESCLSECVRRFADSTMVGGGPGCTGCGFCVHCCPGGALRLVWDADSQRNEIIPEEENYYPEIPDFLQEMLELGRRGKVRATMFDCIVLLPPDDVAHVGVKRVTFRDRDEKRVPMMYASSLRSDIEGRTHGASAMLQTAVAGAPSSNIPSSSHHSLNGAVPDEPPQLADCSICSSCEALNGTDCHSGSCLSGENHADQEQLERLEHCPLIHARCPFLHRESHAS